MQIEIIAKNFCVKYELEVGTIFVIDDQKHKKGDIVLAFDDYQCYLCENVGGKFIDIKTKEEVNNVKIKGAVYSKIEIL